MRGHMRPARRGRTGTCACLRAPCRPARGTRGARPPCARCSPRSLSQRAAVSTHPRCSWRGGVGRACVQAGVGGSSRWSAGTAPRSSDRSQFPRGRRSRHGAPCRALPPPRQPPPRRVEAAPANKTHRQSNRIYENENKLTCACLSTKDSSASSPLRHVSPPTVLDASLPWSGSMSGTHRARRTSPS